MTAKLLTWHWKLLVTILASYIIAYYHAGHPTHIIVYLYIISLLFLVYITDKISNIIYRLIIMEAYQTPEGAKILVTTTMFLMFCLVLGLDIISTTSSRLVNAACAYDPFIQPKVAISCNDAYFTAYYNVSMFVIALLVVAHRIGQLIAYQITKNKTG